MRQIAVVLFAAVAFAAVALAGACATEPEAEEEAPAVEAKVGETGATVAVGPDEEEAEPVEPVAGEEAPAAARVDAKVKAAAAGAIVETQIEALTEVPVLRPEVLGTLKNHHRALDTPITAENVSTLKFDWMVETTTPVSHAPLVADNTVYFADWDGNAYAVEQDTGDVIWKRKIQETVKQKWPWHGFAGTGTIAGDKLIEASVEGRAYGIDRESGEVIWDTQIAEDPHAGSLATMLNYDGLVYIGLTSVEEMLDKKVPNFEPDFQGKVLALDVETGGLVWERQLVEKPQNGVTVWSSFALDPATNALYFTTSNNYTGKASDKSDAMVVVDAKTGELFWYDQVTQHDVWTKARPKGPDYAFGAGPQLFEAMIDGEQRQLVGAGQKSGVFYVWDRMTGERVWTVTVGYGHIGGGIHGEASVGDDRLIIWGNNAFPYKDPKKHPMDIKAVDKATGELLWVNPKAQPAVQIAAGKIANDVYLAPSMVGHVHAYRVSDGKHLAKLPTRGPLASSLKVSNGHLMWGNGVPKKFGGADSGYGMVAYALSP